MQKELHDSLAKFLEFCDAPDNDINVGYESENNDGDLEFFSSKEKTNEFYKLLADIKDDFYSENRIDD